MVQAANVDLPNLLEEAGFDVGSIIDKYIDFAIYLPGLVDFGIEIRLRSCDIKIQYRGSSISLSLQSIRSFSRRRYDLIAAVEDGMNKLFSNPRRGPSHKPYKLRHIDWENAEGWMARPGPKPFIMPASHSRLLSWLITRNLEIDVSMAGQLRYETH